MKTVFARNKRLKNREIQALLKKANKAGNGKFVLYAAKNTLSFCRIAISISRKVIKLSSKRNLFRRRIKAAILEAEKTAAIPGGYDIFIIVKAAEPESYEAIKKKTFNLLKKVK